MASDTCSGFHHAHRLLPPVSLLIGLTPLMDAGGIPVLVPSRAPSNCTIGCLSGSGLLPTLLAPPSNKISQNMLGRPSVSAQQEKSPEEAQTSVHSALAVLIGSFSNLSCGLGTGVYNWYLPAAGLASGEMAWQRLG